MKKREKAFVKWRRRARRAEAQVEALEMAFMQATGMTIGIWRYRQGLPPKPGENVKIENIEIPL